MQPAPTCTVQAATLPAAPAATVQAAELTTVQPAPATTVQAVPLPAVQPAPTATVQTADLTTLEPALAATVSVFPAVQIHPSPIALSGFYGFPHLLLTGVVVNGETRGQQHYRDFTFDVPRAEVIGPFYLVTRGRRVGVFETWCVSSLVTCSRSDSLAGNVHPLMLLALAAPLSPDAGHWMMV